MYTIGQISELFGLPVSTLRYYDNEGLLPGIQRRSGIRQFGEREVEALRVIECLKSSGLGIRDIKQFMAWCDEGPASYGKRKALFEARKAAVTQELERLQKTLDMISFKCWYYEEAQADGSEARIQAMMPDKLPPDIQALYDHARS